jgi:uncharacterized protein (TIGR02466 family)
MVVMSKVKQHFATSIYCAPLLRDGSGLVRELCDESWLIYERDRAGRQWSKKSYPGGYTSYGSLDRLHQMSSTFMTLNRHIDRHVQSYVRTLAWDLQGGRLVMTDCWLNIMPKGCAHSFHIHPHAVISGTYYVQTPAGSAGIKFEDPRLVMQMASPLRSSGEQAHVEYPADAGALILFESWLRHEVPVHTAARERISISFNYHWVV